MVANGNACSVLARDAQLAGQRSREAAGRIIRDGKEAGRWCSYRALLFKRASVEKVVLDLNGR